jgi:hypothetical protein
MSASKVRTVCGSSARTDLCGGRSAMTVPTAITLSGSFLSTRLSQRIEAREMGGMGVSPIVDGMV